MSVEKRKMTKTKLWTHDLVDVEQQLITGSLARHWTKETRGNEVDDEVAD